MQQRLPRTVVVLGCVSFFNDLASEMVTPLIPILIATVLGAGPIALGLVEGIAEAIAAFLKLWSGRHSDWLGGRRKWLTFQGYLLSNLVRPLFGVASSWLALVALRSIDRIGKGVRSAPRDALVADATQPEMRGHAYGFQRALDNAGATGGGLIAAAVLTWTQLSPSQVIVWSAIPGFVVLLLVAFGIQENVKHVAPALREPLPALRWGNVPLPMQRYLMVLFLFTLARASETFIILRGHELGMSAVTLLLLWSALNASKALSSIRGGKLADRFGLERLVLIGWVGYALSFGFLSNVHSSGALWLTVMGYGVVTGLSEGAERALIGDFAVERERGTAFGWYNMVLGLAAIPGGLAFGGLWHFAGPAWAFGAAGVVAVLAALMLHFWVWRPTHMGGVA